MAALQPAEDRGVPEVAREHGDEFDRGDMVVDAPEFVLEVGQGGEVGFEAVGRQQGGEKFQGVAQFF